MTDPSATETITSAANPRVRHAAALRDSAARRATGHTLVDGRRELSRALAAGVPVEEVFVTADRRADDAPFLADLAARGTPLTRLAERPFEKVAFGSRDEGVVGVVRFGPRPLAAVAFAADRPVLVAEGVEKPGNLGAIIRTADAAGLAGVIVCDAATDVANPAVIRASLGTVFSVPVATATAAETLAWLGNERRRAIAADPEGALLWHEARLAGATALVLGSEARGLSPAWAAAAREAAIDLVTVRLPMHGAADSLNVSATAAVLAYEALRQAGAAHG
jgi:TrmH family RNA methyltransferase